MKASLAKSAKNAAKLTEKKLLVRIQDALTDQIVATTSLPWQLGHGEWVVKVEGKSGGWSCAMLTVIENVTRIEFEDQGQDFTRWTIHEGKVIECAPSQSFIWVGCKVLSKVLKAGQCVEIETKHGDAMVVRYPLEKVEQLTGKVVAL